MNSDDSKEDKAKDSKEYLRRVDYGYVFNFTGRFYQAEPQEATTQVDEQKETRAEQLPIVVTINNSTSWVDRLVALLAVIISIATVILLYFTVQYARGQWVEANRTADASVKAVDLGAKQFAASEAAVLQPNITIGGIPKYPRHPGNPPTAETAHFIQIDIINSGRISATKVFGKITTTPNLGTISIKNATVPSHVASPEYQTGFISRAIPLTLTALPFMDYSNWNHQKISLSLNYWNGVENVQAEFCYMLHTDFTQQPTWNDCDYEKALK